MRMLRTKEARELELKKKRVSVRERGEPRRGEIREDRGRLKLFELSPRSAHSFGILLKSVLLLRLA